MVGVHTSSTSIVTIKRSLKHNMKAANEGVDKPANKRVMKGGLTENTSFAVILKVPHCFPF